MILSSHNCFADASDLARMAPFFAAEAADEARKSRQELEKIRKQNAEAQQACICKCNCGNS